jgi:thermitase
MLLAATPAAAQLMTATDSQGEYVRGRVLVGVRAGLADTELGKIAGAHGGRARAIGQSGLFIIDLPPQASETAVAQQLARNPQLKFAELDRRLKPGFASNDPYVGSSWHLAKIGATTAWDSAQGVGITVAVLDTGVTGSHPDLVNQMVPGWNVAKNSSNTADVMGHGTWVAGALAATLNNGIGVAGVAGKARIMPIQIADDSTGMASYSSMTQGIIYAADHGARIANLSYVGTLASSTILSAAQYMKGKNGLVFVAAGNQGAQESWSSTTSLIPVSATNSSDQLASFSSWGSYVSISAPGDGIYTTTGSSGYTTGWGTSFATPVAAGVAALVMSAKPGLSGGQVESILFSTAADLGANGRDSQFGYGRVNAAGAIAAAMGTSSTSPPPADTTAPTAAIAAPLAGSTVSGLVPVDVSASDNVGVSKVELRVNGAVVATDTGSPFAFSWDSTRVANGSANLQAVAYDAAGNAGASTTTTVSVSNTTVAPPPPSSSDTTPPSVTILNPTSSVVTSNFVTVSSGASDNAGAAGITQSLYINGVLKSTASGGSMSYRWNTRKLGAGTYTLQVVARDQAGNAATTAKQISK